MKTTMTKTKGRGRKKKKTITTSFGKTIVNNCGKRSFILTVVVECGQRSNTSRFDPMGMNQAQRTLLTFQSN